VQGFFEPRSRGPGRPRPPDRRPGWLGPPEDSFGVLVPLGLVLVRTVDLAVAIPSATGYRTGFGFDLAFRRAAVEDDAFALDRTLHWLGREGSPPPEVLRVGVRAECLDWLLIAGRGHLERILRVYVSHYNQHRPHRALGLQPSDQPARLTVDAEDQQGRVRRPDLLGGLLHEYRRAA
jgi:hypothetical protein